MVPPSCCVSVLTNRKPKEETGLEIKIRWKTDPRIAHDQSVQGAICVLALMKIDTDLSCISVREGIFQGVRDKLADDETTRKLRYPCSEMYLGH